ncbi:MAG: NifU family protein [Planctomycetota bacterium]
MTASSAESGTQFDASAALPVVAEVIASLRPVIQADGGDVELLGLTDEGIIRVKLKGACVGCPSASMTLRDGIERSVREKVPGITGIQALDH